VSECVLAVAVRELVFVSVNVSVCSMSVVVGV